MPRTGLPVSFATAASRVALTTVQKNSLDLPKVPDYSNKAEQETNGQF
jgi:hypothetical protein